jgi:hypothetical protein
MERRVSPIQMEPCGQKSNWRIGPEWIKQSPRSPKTRLDTPRSEGFLSYIDHLTKQLSSSITLPDRRFLGTPEIEGTSVIPTSLPARLQIEVAEYLLDMIGLRRDGQVDHRTLVRNIITVLRRPELPPLDFDDGVLGLFLANSEADKMDMDSMVGDI